MESLNLSKIYLCLLYFSSYREIKILNGSCLLSGQVTCQIYLIHDLPLKCIGVLQLILLTLISLKTIVPHNEATTEGPVVTIGNATGIDKDLLATNQQLVATDHITPDTIPGRMTLG